MAPVKSPLPAAMFSPYFPSPPEVDHSTIANHLFSVVLGEGGHVGVPGHGPNPNLGTSNVVGIEAHGHDPGEVATACGDVLSIFPVTVGVDHSTIVSPLVSVVPGEVGHFGVPSHGPNPNLGTNGVVGIG
ncbi:CAP (Cysteine-rich secretory proteins, Antigen 5, and Pathogenesis-related 1 protein) superfamily protein [Actinidia rufa]|uniref:CAP (Cysteine-rich secretory proteins, Antigen 5, and Pathogenesis-related 1 protein) superfamily protein n=1 Tax=Actinidia rufa TaxID=165716 RepID=A0A7J0EV59_9ERIC|nr:CAP (Cysteine-rich secretory proteins, Antigen 5, and Pathogenesis-related 1 protein) superfamily protein [Actinidia rufa]